MSMFPGDMSSQFRAYETGVGPRPQILDRFRNTQYPGPGGGQVYDRGRWGGRSPIMPMPSPPWMSPRPPMFPPRRQPMPPMYRNPYAPSPFYQRRGFDPYAPMMPQGRGRLGPVWGGGMGQVNPTNIPFRDPGYGSPMMSQNLIQSLSGPNNLMNPYRRDTTLGMMDRFRGHGGGFGGGFGGGWGGMPNDPYYGGGFGGGYGQPPGGGFPGGGMPPGRPGGKGGRSQPGMDQGYDPDGWIDRWRELNTTDDGTKPPDDTISTTTPTTTTQPVDGFTNREDWAASLGEGQGGYRTSFVNPELFIARNPDGTLKRFESEAEAQNWAGSSFETEVDPAVLTADGMQTGTGTGSGTDPNTTTTSDDPYQNWLNNLTDQQRRNLQFQAQRSTMGGLEGGIAGLANVSPMARQYMQAEADRANALMNYSSSLSPEQRFARSTALDNMARRYARGQEGLMPLENRRLEDSQRQRLNELIEFYQGRGG